MARTARRRASRAPARDASVGAMHDVFDAHERWPGADGVMLHVATAGAGPPVLLLHGFPESHLTWRKQVRPLVEAGFKVVVPDLRGYGGSDKPRGLDAYRLRPLVDDVAALVRATGAGRAHVVGHDWGGVIAYAFAGAHPDLVDRLAILNAPHTGVYLREMLRPPQLLRSWYVALIQLPFVPERAIARADFGSLRTMFRRAPAKPGAFDEATIDAFVDGLKQPGALAAALAYYRAARRPSSTALGAKARIEAPTLVLWGELDFALDVRLLDGLDRYVEDLRIVRYFDVAHWIQNEIPEEVSRRLIEHLRG